MPAMIALRNLPEAARAFGACCALLALAAYASPVWAQSKGGGQTSGAASACQGGYVHEDSGLVSIKKAAAKAAPAQVGDVFEAETIFRTSPDAKVILKFADGEIVVLSANSVLRVGQYCYTPGSVTQSSSTIELMQGEMRVVTGVIGTANHEGVRIIAGDTMIRILSPGGADFTVAVNLDPQESGYAVVARGEISARTPYGRISTIAAGQYAPWQPGRTPPLPMPIAAAPAVVQAAVAALWATVLPANTPVTVASAARTVMAVAPVAAVAATPAGPATAAVDADPTKPAGFVQAVSSTVSMQTSSGKTETAAVGTVFGAGTTINTGSDGRVVLRFADGELVILGPASTLAVGQYQFDPGNTRSSRSTIDLVDGAMRFISGSIHTENHEGIVISTGASIIDILNTTPADFTVVVDTKNQEVGVARVTLGEISVHTPYGPIDRIKADQSSLWGPRATPTSPISVASALAVVEAAVALQLSGLPDSTPIAVEATARAAAAAAAAARAQAAAAAKPENARLQAEAQAATDLADFAIQAAAAANEALAAKIVATTLENLSPMTAGPALAQVAAAPAATLPPPVAPIIAAPGVTPGAGGGACTGSPC